MILSVNLLVKILYSFVNVNFDGSVLFFVCFCFCFVFCLFVCLLFVFLILRLTLLEVSLTVFLSLSVFCYMFRCPYLAGSMIPSGPPCSQYMSNRCLTVSIIVRFSLLMVTEIND